MDKGHKLVLGAVAVGFFVLGAITLSVRQRVQVVEVPAPTPVVTVSPTATPSAALKVRSVVTTVPTRIGSPAAATKAAK